MKALFLSLSGIGNFIMQSPVFAAVHETFPDLEIHVWVAPRGTKALAKSNPHITQVIESPIKLPLARHLQLVWRLAREKYDFAVMLSPGQLWKGAAYMYLAGIPRRIAHQYPFRGNHHSPFLLTDSIPENPQLHDIEQNLHLLPCLKIKNWKLKMGVPYSLTLSLSAERQAQSLLNSLQLPPGAPLIGFHPGSAPGFAWKRWPIERFADVAIRLQPATRHLPPFFLIFGGPDENDLKSTLQTLIGANQSTIINADLLTTAAVMRHCRLFVSNDSGLMHLAAAAGVPTIGLFGPTDERQTGPRGKNSLAVRAPDTKPVYHTESNASLNAHPHPSLLALSPEQVLAEIKKLRPIERS